MRINKREVVCSSCGWTVNSKKAETSIANRLYWGFEWRSKTEVLGWTLVHISFGRNKKTGKLMVSKGIIAIGQFGIGIITIAQVGVGLFLV